MIETVALTRELDVRDIPNLSGNPAWASMASAGVERYSLRKGPAKPDGLSLTLSRVGGNGYIRVQATLPTLAYRDPVAKVGTLESDRLMHGIESALTFVHTLLPHVSTAHHSWSVARWDSSITWDVGSPQDASVLSAAHTLAVASAGPRSPVYRIDSDGMTVSRGVRGGLRFDRVYLKSPEARKTFPDVPMGLLRAERENTPKSTRRPRLREFAMSAPFDAASDIEQLGQWMMNACATLQLISADALLIGQENLGEKPNPVEAMKLGGMSVILQSYGMAGLIDRGISRASAYRYRQRIEQLEAAVTEKDIALRMVDFMDEALTAWSGSMLRYGSKSQPSTD